MRIVIPMAGQSRRFFDEGYTVPKFFLSLGEKTMIERVVGMFDPTDQFLFIVNGEQDGQFRIREFLNLLPVAKSIVTIPSHSIGPVQSLLLAKDFVGADEEVVVNYCDFLMDWDYPGFLSAVRAGGYDGGLVSFRGFHPASLGDTYYAYMRVNENNELLEVREKMPFTDNRIEEHASTGTYYFKSWGAMQVFAEALLAGGAAAPNKEFYPSLIYNLMRDAGRRSLVYRAKKFVCLGTPKDYREYEFWREYFSGV